MVVDALVAKWVAVLTKWVVYAVAVKGVVVEVAEILTVRGNKFRAVVIGAKIKGVLSQGRGGQSGGDGSENNAVHLCVPFLLLMSRPAATSSRTTWPFSG